MTRVNMIGAMLAEEESALMLLNARIIRGDKWLLSVQAFGKSLSRKAGRQHLNLHNGRQICPSTVLHYVQ